MTAHMVIDCKTDKQQITFIKNKLKHTMQHMNIQHVTLETEFSDEDCKKPECQ